MEVVEGMILPRTSEEEGEAESEEEEEEEEVSWRIETRRYKPSPLNSM